jgi:hypothetical protein
MTNPPTILQAPTGTAVLFKWPVLCRQCGRWTCWFINRGETKCVQCEEVTSCMTRGLSGP